MIWFDFSYPQCEVETSCQARATWIGRAKRWCGIVRRLQPDIIINNRLDLAGLPPDIVTPEQYVPRAWPERNGKRVTWEACHTLSGSWGYHRDEATWKSPEQLVQLLIDNVAMGGNLLMNVGPTARGALDHRAVDALAVYEAWMTLHERSIYGCTESEFPAPRDCRYTQNGNRLYLHIFNWPFRHLHLDGLGGKIDYAQFLHDGSEVKWLPPSELTLWSNTRIAVSSQSLTLELPVKKPAVTVPVIELFLEE